MVGPTDRAVDSELLKTATELRAPLFIAFVVAITVARYLDAVGLDLVGDVLVLLAVLPLIVAGVGLLRTLGARFERRRSAW